MRHLRTPLLAMLVVLALVGCGPLKDTKDTVKTVDEAVALLQAIDQDGAWAAVADGLDALGDVKGGYVAEFRAPGPADSPASETVIAVRAAADGTVFEVTGPDGTATYFVPVPATSDAVPPVYRLEGDRYVCASLDALTYTLLSNGVEGLFEHHIVPFMLNQSLSAVEKQDNQGDARVIDRKVTRYAIVSKLPDALDILDRFDDQALRARVEAAQPLTVSGSLALDKDTGALLSFEMQYDDDDQAAPQTITFSVTQWGGVADTLPAPVDATCP